MIVKLRKVSAALFVCALIVAGLWTVISPKRASATGAQAQGDVTKEIEQMEAKLAATNRSRDAAAIDQLYWDDYIDIHASGWIYTKKQNRELSDNLAALFSAANKAIKTNEIGRKVVVFNKDAAEVVWENETYYEVPDPEQVALQAGLLTEDPKALKEAASKGSTIGPGDGPAPNPYRVRNTRLWVRFDGQWKIASSTSTRVSERVVPGRF
jgi:hypothetical protein